MSINIFREIHSNLPREGPGSNVATQKAFSIVKHNLPNKPAILDVGCGPGMQTIQLASETEGSIIAVDLNESFLTELGRRAVEAGVNDRITPMKVSMFELPFGANEFDLIWSEGAIYILGFEKGLLEWRHLLKPNGYMVVSELTWLNDERPKEIETYWTENYPGMKTVNENLELIRNAGYEIIESFVLEESGWWDHYYHPIAERIKELRNTFRDNQEAQKSLDITQNELTMYQNYSAYYGYVFYIMRKTDSML